MHTPTPILEALEDRHLLALTAVDTTEECAEVVDPCSLTTETLNPQDYNLDDQNVRDAILQLLNEDSTESQTHDIDLPDEEVEGKKHKHSKLGKLKNKISHEASTAKKYVESQVDELKEQLSRDLDKLKAKLTPEEFKAELSKIEKALIEGAREFKGDISHGIGTITSGITSIDSKIDNLFTLPQACLAYYLAGGQDADPSAPYKPLFASKIDHLMQKGIERLESHADWVVQKLTEMPEGKRKEVLTSIIAISSDVGSSLSGKMSHFLEGHSEINEDLLHYLTILTHVSSKAFKGTSWGLKLTSTGLKLATLGGFPELALAAILVGSGGSVAGHGSWLLEKLEGELPDLASERSELFSAGAQAGQQAHDIWKEMSERLRNQAEPEEHLSLNIQNYDLDDEETRKTLFYMLNPEAREDTSASHKKFSLGKLKGKIVHDARSAEHFLSKKTDDFKEQIAADLGKLKSKLTPEEIVAELQSIQGKLKNGVYGLKEDIEEGINRIESGIDSLEEKAEYLFSLPEACLTYYFASNQNDSEDPHKTIIADKLGTWMQQGVSKLENHADWVVHTLNKMPEGKRKEVLTKIISTSADTSGAIVGEISNFLERHEEINEDLLHYLTVLTHVSSIALKGTSWGLKLTTMGLKVATIAGLPEAGIAAIIVGSGATVTGVGSSILGEFKDQLPHLADERSSLFSAGADAGHQAQDIWSSLSNQLESTTRTDVEGTPIPTPVQV